MLMSPQEGPQTHREQKWPFALHLQKSPLQTLLAQRVNDKWQAETNRSRANTGAELPPPLMPIVALAMPQRQHIAQALHPDPSSSRCSHIYGSVQQPFASAYIHRHTEPGDE